MISFGSSNDHSNYITFGDSTVIGWMDAFCGVLILCRLRLKSSSGSLGYILGKQGSILQGWGLRFDLGVYGTKPEFFYRSVRHNDWRYHRCTTALIVNDWYTLAFSWQGDNYGFWCLNGLYNNTTDSGASGKDFVIPATTTTPFMIGNAGGYTTYGGAIDIDNVIVIPNLRLRQNAIQELAADFHAGFIRPWALQNRWLRSRDSDPGIALGPWFWWIGDYQPGYNSVKNAIGGQESGTTGGTVTAIKDECNSPPWIFLDVGGSPSMSVSGIPAPLTKIGRIPIKMYTEVIGRNRTYIGLKLQLPDNNDLGFATSSLPTSEQEYDLKVKSWSVIKRSSSDQDFRLTPVETSIVVADPDKSLVKLLSGKLDGRAEGSPAKIRLVSPYVGGWMTLYDGIFRRWSPRGDLPEVTLHLGPNDKQLRSENKLGYYTRDLFPVVPSSIEGTPCKIIYGTLDSIVGGGPIKCDKVDPWNYVVSVGMVTPLGVYQAGTMLDPGSGTAEYKIYRCRERGGRWFTELYIVTQPGSAEIKADVEGVAPITNKLYVNEAPYVFWPDYWNYDVPITNPAEQLLHFLVNFIFGFYESGPWLVPTSDMPINVESFIEAASWFRMRGIKGRTVVYGNETGYKFINRWTSAWRMPIYWDSSGRLAVKPFKHDVVRSDQLHIVDREHGVSDLSLSPTDDTLADEVLIRHNYDWFTEDFDDETRSRDLSRLYGIVYKIEQDWSSV